MQLDALARMRASMLACQRCDELVKCRSRVVPGDGAAPATIAFVGLAPGRFGGDRTGIPFSGDRSGSLLRQMIDAAGLRRVFITNLVRCNPRDRRGRNRDPTAAEIANCRSHLASELALVRPRLVACLGRVAWRELAGRDASFDPTHARPQFRDGRLLYPMYHPAYVNRGAYARSAYAQDFARLAEMARMDGLTIRRPRGKAPARWRSQPNSSARACGGPTT